MNKHLCIVAAAALAVGGMNYSFAQDAAPAAQADQPNALERAADKTGDAIQSGAEKTGDALKSAGDKTKDALGIDNTKTSTPSAEEIHDVLAQVAEAAFTKDGLDDMAERFVDADRNRLGQNKDALDEDDAFEQRISALNDAWKSKYGESFDVKDEDKVYGGFAMITEGEIGSAARTAGERVSGDATTAGPGAAASGNVGGVSGSATVNPDAGTANVNVDNKTGVDAPKANTDGQTAADTNRNDAGRNIATVTFPASHGLAELKVPMIHEAGGWKIDIPDSVDAAKLNANVSKALQMCADKQAEWPADAAEAQRGATHKVLAAIFDKLDQPAAGADAHKASDLQRPSDAPAAAPQ